MTYDLEAVVLDVGHGNCAVLRDGERCAVVDVPKDNREYEGRALYAELSRSGVTRIEHVIISHADADHTAGVTELLSDVRFTIGTLWFNSDGTKNTQTWRDLCRQALLAHQEGRVTSVQSVNSSTPDLLSFGRIGIRILHPDPEWAMLGPSSYPTDYGTLTANRVSIVVHASLAGTPAALLAADIDRAALDRIAALGIEMAAPVLVFPHHGGRSKGQEVEFAKKLAEMVKPQTIVFSIAGGDKYKNPNPQIIAGARAGAPNAGIACTQLSVRCHPPQAEVDSTHLNNRPAAARSRGRCCAGTVAVSWTPRGLILSPDTASHVAFVDAQLHSPLCRPVRNLPPPSVEDGNPSQNLGLPQVQ